MVSASSPRIASDYRLAVDPTLCNGVAPDFDRSLSELVSISSMMPSSVNTGNSGDFSTSDPLSYSTAAVRSQVIPTSSSEPATAHTSNVTPTPRPDRHDVAALVADVSTPPITRVRLIDVVAVDDEKSHDKRAISSHTAARSPLDRVSEGVRAPRSSPRDSFLFGSALGTATPDAIVTSQSSISTPLVSVLEHWTTDATATTEPA